MCLNKKRHCILKFHQYYHLTFILCTFDPNVFDSHFIKLSADALGKASEPKFKKYVTMKNLIDF